MNFCLLKLPNLLWIDTSGIKADTYVVVIVPDAYKHCIFILFFLYRKSPSGHCFWFQRCLLMESFMVTLNRKI